MPDDEVERFVRRYGLPDAARGDLEGLLRSRTLVPVEADPGATLDLTPTEERDLPVPEQLTARYVDLGLLGTGGMSEVRRVRDAELERVLAMKIADPVQARNPAALDRFVGEARTTAQLDHPGVVPVHELGRTADGRLFFTMKEVRGRTLREVIAQVHGASPAGAWGETADGWNLHRLLDAWRRVCETVAHAHARGVVHRDLKPDNVMVGAYGEVLVLDWGLARTSGAEAARATLAGTPMYMSPEQARGELDGLDARSDVYALGVVLYEVLHGQAPYPGADVDTVLRRVAGERLEAPSPSRAVPDALVTLWRACTERDRERRPADAGVLAERMRRFQEGAERRMRAMQLVAEAGAALPGVQDLRRRAEAARAEAQRRGQGVQPWDPVERKRELWAAEDDADRLERQAELEELRSTELLRAALSQAPDLGEARAALADLYRERHADAEARGDARAAARFEVLLRSHDDGRHAAYLEGRGALTLLTDPGGAEVEALRFVERDRRLVAEPFRALGATPLRAVTLPMGSYILVLRHPERAEVRYPARIDRGGHWDGVPPGAGAALPVRLPLPDELGPDDVHVPAGPFLRGGDPDAPECWPRGTIWVDAFVARRFPVTNAEYVAFLDDLVRRGREDDALRHVPRMPRAGGTGAPVYGRTADGGFCLVPDGEGDRWGEDWPVLLVDFADAVAFAEWEAERTGRPWRLPTEDEWEKAARGVDGRRFPWGNVMDPTWACLRTSRPGRHLPAPVTSFPGDESPYGVRGLGGNAASWTSTRPDSDADERVTRGGAWSFAPSTARSALRIRTSADRRAQTLGFRLVRSADAGRSA